MKRKVMNICETVNRFVQEFHFVMERFQTNYSLAFLKECCLNWIDLFVKFIVCKCFLAKQKRILV